MTKVHMTNIVYGFSMYENIYIVRYRWLHSTNIGGSVYISKKDKTKIMDMIYHQNKFGYIFIST